MPPLTFIYIQKFTSTYKKAVSSIQTKNSEVLILVFFLFILNVCLSLLIMLFYIIFVQYVAIVSTTQDFLSSLLDGLRSEYSQNETQIRQRRVLTEDKDYSEYLHYNSLPSCHELSVTSNTPFIVLLLYKTSGRFLGMGSIIDKKTVLTASTVILGQQHSPHKLLAMAGRLNAWWGKGAQVHPASEVFLSTHGLAILKLKNPFEFTKMVLPIHIATQAPPVELFVEEYDRHWGVFGIPRGSWNIPGEPAPKTNIYILRVETEPEKMEELEKCKDAYPDLIYNATTMTCTIANGTFCWGCLGSPVVAINKKNRIVQIGVVIRAAYTDNDQFHALVKIGYHEQWIRSNSLIGYSRVY